MCCFRRTFNALLVLLSSTLLQVSWGQVEGEARNGLGPEFNPLVTAVCRKGIMTITVQTEDPFFGVIHARDYRKDGCLTYGIGARNTTLNVHLHAESGAPDYCGVVFNNRTEETSVPIAVRAHQSLELADDKYYVITCGRFGYRNSRNETSLVSLMLLDNGKKTMEAVYGRQYILRAKVSKPDGAFGIKVKNCFGFSGENSTALIDEHGCPMRKVISKFRYNSTIGAADAIIFSMFKFPHNNKVHFQCDIAICRGLCEDPVCSGDGGTAGRALPQGPRNSLREEEEGTLLASTTVFVLEPGDPLVLAGFNDECGVAPGWLFILCVILGVLFLIMMIINIFLCSSMTCSCTRTEVVEKEPSISEDYDPYKDPYKTWNGSHYGSRYSLNGGKGNPGYASGGSTMNSTRSYSTNSDHYAIVHSRPGSRGYSAAAKQLHPTSSIPRSTHGSHYSGRM